MKKKRPHGQLFERLGKVYYRIRIGATRPSLPVACPWGKEAEARRDVLEAIVTKMRDAGHHELLEELLREAAAAPDLEVLEGTLQVVDDICRGRARLRPDISPNMLFDDLVQKWISNELHAVWPDQIRKLKRNTAEDYRSFYTTWVKGRLGHLPVRAISLDHAFDVMQEVPRNAGSNSLRRNVATVIQRPLRIAVFPARIIEASPIPAGFLPKKSKGRAKVYLYPKEDQQLLACREVPLVLRVFYGVLAREGPRVSELARLTVGDFDLENGVMILDENKTDEPRSWPMQEGTATALRLWLEHFHPDPQPSAKMFLHTGGDHSPEHVRRALRTWVEQGHGVNRLGERMGVTGATVSLIRAGKQAAGPKVLEGFARIVDDEDLPEVPAESTREDGRELVAMRRATTFRDNLQLAGLKRPQLYAESDARRHIVIHDLRATFVTVHLALGMPEAWIVDRTGHKSSAMVYTYKREVRAHQELRLGALEALCDAIPELREAARVGTPRWTPSPAARDLTEGELPMNPQEFAASRQGSRGLQRLDSKQRTAKQRVARRSETPQVEHAETRQDRPGVHVVPETDPVERALALGLEEATKAHEWDVVSQLVRELEARRTARAEPNVVRLPTRGTR